MTTRSIAPLLGVLAAAPRRTVDPCLHEAAPSPPFDEEAARGLSSTEIQRRWPRWVGRCPGCGQVLIRYASALHYVAGDW